MHFSEINDNITNIIDLIKLNDFIEIVSNGYL